LLDAEAGQAKLDALATLSGLNENDLVEVAIRLARLLYECRSAV
jgi:hypothetical protein